MKFFITLSRKGVAVILAAVIIAIILTAQVFSGKMQYKDGSTNALRTDYLKSLRLSVDDSNVTCKDIVIPSEFSPVYKKYNALQKEAGFDLTQYKGKNASVYTYCLNGSDRKVHIIVYNGKIIGGDISDVELNGEMSPLKAIS